MDLRASAPPPTSPAAAPAPRQTPVAAAAAPAPTPLSPAEAGPPARELGEHLRRTVEAVAEQLREYLRSNSRELEFHVDTTTDTTVITVRDAAGAVVRQIPNEDALRLQRVLNAQSGTFLDLFV